VFATDALSEGVNLHRAGVIINYDIPYNPTRVIQRVGRINRINKKVFDNIHVYNFFPTSIGESETKLKAISTLKITLINAIIGSDTKHLTPDESLESFFKNQYEEIAAKNDELSWDAIHIEHYHRAIKHQQTLERARRIPRRSRIKRNNTGANGTIAFGKKGRDAIFALGLNGGEVQIVGAEEALPYFVSAEEEVSFKVDASFTQLMKVVRDRLFERNHFPPVKGRRQKAIEILNALINERPQYANYCRDLIRVIKDFDDLSEGTLKDISKINLHDLDKSVTTLMKIVPQSMVQSTLSRVEKSEESQEMLLLLEEHS